MKNVNIFLLILAAFAFNLPIQAGDNLQGPQALVDEEAEALSLDEMLEDDGC